MPIAHRTVRRHLVREGRETRDWRGGETGAKRACKRELEGGEGFEDETSRGNAGVGESEREEGEK